MSFEAFVGILNNAAFLLALGVLYNTFSDTFFADSKKNKVIIGIFIGLLCMLVMLCPWKFAQGVVFDTRSILLSVAALFFGGVPVLISMIMTAALRIYQGGSGMFMGVGVIVTSTFFGLLLRFFLLKCSRKVQDVKWYELFLLGIVVHVAMILWVFVMPASVSGEVFLIIIYPIISIYPIATVFLGILLAKQIKRRAQQTLLKNKESQFKKAERIAGLGYWTFDFNTGNVIASEDARTIYGLERTDIKIDFVRDCSLPEYKEMLAAEMESLIKRGESYDVNFKIKRPNDGRVVDIRSVAEFDKENNLVFGVIYDETEKKKMLEQMGKVDKIESLGVLAGGLAHDFNNLLGGIFGNIELALNEEMSAGARECLKNSLGIHHRAASLTRQLLTFAKGGAPEKRLGNVEKTIRESVLFALTGTSVVPEFNIDNDLADVEFDKNQISEVISNIAINAQQAMNGAGQFVVSADNVEIADDKVIDDGNYVKISFKDSGPGISEQIQGKIFDPFFSTKETGSGLGLAMSYSVIKKHDGFLFVESSVGKGAVFIVFLPVPEKTEETLSHKKNAKVLKGAGRILIMDDEDFIRSVVGEMISAMGYTPIMVSNGEEAVKAVRESREKNEKISLVLLDLTVPGGMGGAVAVKKIKEIFPQIPVIASSGYSDDPIIFSPKEHGFDDSLKKPFLFAGLSEVINRNIN